jgi:hypothetical protein
VAGFPLESVLLGSARSDRSEPRNGPWTARNQAASRPDGPAAALGGGKQMRTLRLGLLVVVGTGLAGPTAPRAAASDNCKPTVVVANDRPANGRTIKVLKFKYRITGSPQVHTESLVNKNIDPGHSADWPSQNLGAADLGTLIDQTAIEFKDDTGRGWGPAQTSSWFPHTFDCGNNHNYIQRVN